MSPIGLALAERLHGHLGVLTAAALFHPAMLLRRRRRGTSTIASVATLLATLTGSIGLTLYPRYRATVKPVLFAKWPSAGWAFERKEHLGVAVVLLSWAGLGALWANSRNAPGAPVGFDRVARLAYFGAAVSATVVSLLGVWAASHATFG